MGRGGREGNEGVHLPHFAFRTSAALVYLSKKAVITLSLIARRQMCLCTVCGKKKVSPKVFCHFLSNRSEFLHEISHIYYSFIV